MYILISNLPFYNIYDESSIKVLSALRKIKVLETLGDIQAIIKVQEDLDDDICKRF
jgi:hypothetical protein